MNDTKMKVLWGVALLSFVAMFLFSLFMGGCTSTVDTASGGSVPMKCHWTFIAVKLVSLVGVTLAALGAISYDTGGKRACLLGIDITNLVILGLMTDFFGIGVYSHEGSPCTTTKLCVTLCILVGIIASIVLSNLVRKQDRAEDIPKKEL